jgi:hypothetical protein
VGPDSECRANCVKLREDFRFPPGGLCLISLRFHSFDLRVQKWLAHGAVGLCLTALTPSCAYLPADALDGLNPGYAVMAEGIPESVDLTTLTGIGWVSDDQESEAHPAGLYLISTDGAAATFTALPLTRDSADESAVSVTDFYDTPLAYIASVSGLYTSENDPLTDCTTLFIRKADGRFFCARFQLLGNAERSLPAPVRTSGQGLSFYLLGLWTSERLAAVASLSVPTAPEEGDPDEATTFRSLSSVYRSAGEFSVNSEEEVLHSDLAAVVDSDTEVPTLRVVSAAGVTTLVEERAFCLMNGVGADDQSNFYWYSTDDVTFTLRKGSRNPSTSAFTAANQAVTFPAGPGTHKFSPGSISVSDPEPCKDGQVFSTENATYLVGTKTTVADETSTTGARLLQLRYAGSTQVASVQAALDPVGDGSGTEDDIVSIEAGKTHEDQAYLLVKYTGDAYGFVRIDDSTPASLADEEWIAKGTYTYTAWRPSDDGKFFFSGTRLSDSKKVLGLKADLATAVVILSDDAPVFSEIGFQPVSSGGGGE